jgi:hypothetical protein
VNANDDARDLKDEDHTNHCAVGEEEEGCEEEGLLTVETRNNLRSASVWTYTFFTTG